MEDLIFDVQHPTDKEILDWIDDNFNKRELYNWMNEGKSIRHFITSRISETMQEINEDPDQYKSLNDCYDL